MYLWRLRIAKLSSRLSATNRFGTHGTFGSLRRHENIVLQLLLCLLVTRSRHELDDQGVFDSEDRVIIEILAILVKNLCGDGLITFNKNLFHISNSLAFPPEIQLTIR